MAYISTSPTKRLSFDGTPSLARCRDKQPVAPTYTHTHQQRATAGWWFFGFPSCLFSASSSLCDGLLLLQIVAVALSFVFLVNPPPPTPCPSFGAELCLARHSSRARGAVLLLVSHSWCRFFSILDPLIRRRLRRFFHVPACLLAFVMCFVVCCALSRGLVAYLHLSLFLSLPSSFWFVSGLSS